MIVPRLRGPGSIIEQILDGPILYACRQPVVKCCGVGYRWSIYCVPSELPQVVSGTAAADDKHSFLAQRGEGLAYFVVMLSIPICLYGKLNNRDIGLREHQLEGDPGPVVESPLGCNRAINSRIPKKFRDFSSKRRLSRTGIAHLVEFCLKSGEIVDRLRQINPSGRRCRCVPVGGDAEDGVRAW